MDIQVQAIDSHANPLFAKLAPVYYSPFITYYIFLQAPKPKNRRPCRKIIPFFLPEFTLPPRPPWRGEFTVSPRLPKNSARSALIKQMRHGIAPVNAPVCQRRRRAFRRASGRLCHADFTVFSHFFALTLFPKTTTFFFFLFSFLIFPPLVTFSDLCHLYNMSQHSALIGNLHHCFRSHGEPKEEKKFAHFYLRLFSGERSVRMTPLAKMPYGFFISQYNTKEIL